jgi:hypothetical protein
MNPINAYVEEEIQMILEGRLGKKQALKNALNDENYGDKDSLVKKAASIIQDNTGEDKRNAAGGIAFSTKDILTVLKWISEYEPYMKKVESSKQLADTAIAACREIIEIGNEIVKRTRDEKGYHGQLAYEVEDREELINAIKTTLKAIYALTKERIKIEPTSEAHTLTIRKLLHKIMEKASSIDKDIESIKTDSESKNAKDKAIATANIKGLDSHVGKNSLSKIAKAFNVVKKYSGSGSLIWPSLSVKIVDDDKYASLFKYLDAYSAGQDKGRADKLVKTYKNREKAEIARRLVVSKEFRDDLKEKIKEKKIHTTQGREQKISDLQALARRLMKAHPEFVSDLKKDGMKETAIDEIVGIIATYIKNGSLFVKVE